MTEADHASMTIEQLQEQHSQMLATANDLGLALPDEVLVEFDTQEDGARICDQTHAAIAKFREGLDAADEQNVLATGEAQEQVVDTPAPPAGKSKKQKPGADAKKAKAPAAQKPKETTVAKKAVAKKAAPVAKKAAKAAPAARKAAAGGARETFPKDARIKVLNAENPARAGSGKGDRIASVLKADGKLVADVLKKGDAKTGTVKYLIDSKHIKLV